MFREHRHWAQHLRSPGKGKMAADRGHSRLGRSGFCDEAVVSIAAFVAGSMVLPTLPEDEKGP